jgi:DNA-directed RNA polymerase subunit beta'
MIIPEIKQKFLEETDKKVEMISKQYRRGMITEDERKNAVVNAWNKTTEDVKNALIAGMDKFNPVFMMSNSGARGNVNQIRQLAGMRGLMADTSGETIEIPIRSNFREGLSVLEYFISTHGARKGLADTALRTADSGYLTRRLVDVSQDVIVRENDCGTDEGITLTDIVTSGETIETLEERIAGRFAAEDVVHPQTKEILVKHHELINDNIAKKIAEAGIKKVRIRSVLTCRTRTGVCSKCYGLNLATGEECNVGEAVGIIAAQSIGEPGTQLTMRTFHTGGVTTGSDITHGLPRVEELFEARTPNPQAILSEISGVVSFAQEKRRDIIRITGEEGVKSYPINYDTRVTVTEGQFIEKGTELTGGSPAPADILEISGLHAVQDYLIREVQSTYRGQGVDINDKHIEIIIRQLLLNVIITDPGDTRLISGVRVSKRELRELVKKARDRYIDANGSDEGFREPETKPVILGLTKASLAADSFLSAASFQEANRVLTEAAVKGKTDRLLGLKENVIVGRLLPAGTGMRIYNNIEVRGEDAAPVEY